MMQKHKIKPIKALMTPFPYSIDASDGIEDASQMMQTHNIRHLPVTEHGKLVGIISDRDLQSLLAFKPTKSITIKDIYNSRFCIADINDRADIVIENMAECHSGSAIITKDGKLVGIYTSTDMCRDFVKLLRIEYHPEGNSELA